jgi:hypothetical protein
MDYNSILEQPWRRVDRVLSNGARFTTWRRIVPRPPEDLARSVVFIYPSERDAREDRRFGGTGFIVGHQEGRQPTTFYIVTAAHVVRGKGPRVIRINTADAYEPVALQEEDWYWEEMGEYAKDDLAICPISFPLGEFDVSYISTRLAVTRDERHPSRPAAGDDVVMIGRFVEYGGLDRNEPILRFGNISLIPSRELRTAKGYPIEALMVEMRSRGGHSGSPVFKYEHNFGAPPVRGWADLNREAAFSGGFTSAFPPRPPEPHLLGIDHGQYPTLLPLVDRDGKEIPGIKVRERSALTVVVPAWCLVELIRRREGSVQKTEVTADKDKQGPIEESDEEALTQEQFEETLRRVSRKVEPPKENG